MTSNLLLKSYLKTDQFLVDRADEAVKAWNWTTGRTRADLANIIQITGNILIGFSSKLFIPIAAINIPTNYILNKETDLNDKRLLDGDVLNYSIEERKKSFKFKAPSLNGLGLSNFAIYYQHNSHILPFDGKDLGLGTMLWGLSYYVMRTDYQAPRKDCVRRGLEKLAEFVKNSREPIPATVDTGGYR